VRIWKVPGQLLRLVLAFVAFIILMVLVREQFVPESFGEIGHYRADAVPEIAAQEIRYAGLQACAECHDDVAEAKAASFHRGLSCEGCHEAAADHVDDPTENLPVMPDARDTCNRCHEYIPSRPTGFPQIIAAIHNPMEACATCHDPHDPAPPETPGQCSAQCAACHAQIARTKAVSHHWSLTCETCHETPEEHRVIPRANLPRKPTDREFCGGCHAAGASGASGVPRIDISEHGGRYLCWQCHYPHDPEGR